MDAAPPPVPPTVVWALRPPPEAATTEPGGEGTPQAEFDAFLRESGQLLEPPAEAEESWMAVQDECDAAMFAAEARRIGRGLTAKGIDEETDIELETESFLLDTRRAECTPHEVQLSELTGAARRDDAWLQQQQRGPQRQRGPQQLRPAGGGRLTAAALAAVPPSQQKQVLGERLYPLVQAARPEPGLAGKVTGMLLELDNSELLRLLESPEQLSKKISQAVVDYRLWVAAAQQQHVGLTAAASLAAGPLAAKPLHRIEKDSLAPEQIAAAKALVAAEPEPEPEQDQRPEEPALAVDCAVEMAETSKDFMDVGIAGVPLIVGKGGVNIKRLQTESGAKIDIERGMTVVGIFGTEEAVAKAKKMIQTQLADSTYSETVECAAGSIGAVIGKGGETIRSIQEESGARVNVERDPPSVKILGSKETVTKARKLVEAVLAKESKAKELPAGHVVETVELPKFAIGSIIGKGGSAIATLQEDSGARVDIQRETDTAKVSGPKESVDKAVASIKATVEAQTELQAKRDAQAETAGSAEAVRVLQQLSAMYKGRSWPGTKAELQSGTGKTWTQLKPLQAMWKASGCLTGGMGTKKNKFVWNQTVIQKMVGQTQMPVAAGQGQSPSPAVMVPGPPDAPPPAKVKKVDPRPQAQSQPAHQSKQHPAPAPQPQPRLEMRVDPADGKPYTHYEFKGQYQRHNGWPRQWDAAEVFDVDRFKQTISKFAEQLRSTWAAAVSTQAIYQIPLLACGCLGFHL